MIPVTLNCQRGEEIASALATNLTLCPRPDGWHRDELLALSGAALAIASTKQFEHQPVDADERHQELLAAVAMYVNLFVAIIRNEWPKHFNADTVECGIVAHGELLPKIKSRRGFRDETERN